jgi:hypothetical protein
MADSLDRSRPRELLSLAAHDLRDAAQAADWLVAMRRQKEPTQAMLYFARAVETGMVVSYWRPFSRHNKFGEDAGKKGYLASKRYVPPEHRELHLCVRTLRNKVYAHIDEHESRNVSYVPGKITVESAFFPIDRLDEMVALCAAVIQKLDGEASFWEWIEPSA